MSPLLGPILAQLVTLGVVDRTDANYVVSGRKYSSVATSPRVGLNFGWQHSALFLGYGPSITVAPLDAKDPDVFVNHSGAIGGSYRWKHTTLTVTEGASYGRVNFLQQALGQPPVAAGTPVTPIPGSSQPPTTGGTPVGPGGTGTTPPPGTTPGAANQIRALNSNVQYASSATTISVLQVVSASFSVSGDVGYLISGSVGSNSSSDYPVTKGPRAQLSARYLLTRRDAVSSTLATQFVDSTTGNNAWILSANESWIHLIDKRTTTTAGTGLSMTRNSQTNGLIGYSIYPNFNLTISRVNPLRDGALSFGASASAAPYIDPVRALVNPQLSFGAFVGWGIGKFYSSAGGGSALSLQSQNDNGTLNSLSASFRVGYQISNGVGIDTGVRAFWQSTKGGNNIPPTYAAFVGLTFGAAVPLNH